MSDKGLKVSIIGAGALGGSLAKGLVKGGIPVWVYDTNREVIRSMADIGVGISSDMKSSLSGFDLVFWALKPHLILSVIKDNRQRLDGVLCCSLAACVNVDLLKKAAPEARWSRAMTNICASVGKAFTGYFPSSDLSHDDRDVLASCLNSVGMSQLVSEADLDGITGISGSGPAYVFTILESFIQGGLAAGLSADLSLKAAAMTLIGSSEMVLKGGEHPASYKDRVCTPAGTTIEALRVLESGGLRSSLIDAVVSASEKGRQGGEALRKKLSEDGI